MNRYRMIIIMLLLVFFTSSTVPAPVYAAGVSGDSSKSIYSTLLELLGGDLLSKLFHINDLPSVNQPMKQSPGTTSGNKDVLGFYAEWWGTDTSSYDDLTKHIDSIGTIAPFWATLHADGSIGDRGGNEHLPVVKYAQGQKVSVLLMINNADQDKQGTGIHTVLSDPSLRKTAIDNIDAYVKKYGLDGVNIDFEMVPASDRDNLSVFMRDLNSRLKPEGYNISIDVIPKHDESNDVAGAYDYAKLAQYTDRIILMTYDYHGTWSGPGSVADIRQVEPDLKYAISLIPKNKVYLGVAGYGYDWSSKGVESVEYSASENLINRFGATVEWDEASASPHFSYTGTDGVVHQVWYENAQSLQYKLNLVNKYDIAGIALWKLGEEDQASWTVVKNSLHK